MEVRSTFYGCEQIDDREVMKHHEGNGKLGDMIKCEEDSYEQIA